jgi:hypothetical protein
MPVCARTVAAKEQLVFVPLEKLGSEPGIARQRVVAGVCRKIGEQVWIVRKPFSKGSKKCVSHHPTFLKVSTGLCSLSFNVLTNLGGLP